MGRPRKVTLILVDKIQNSQNEQDTQIIVKRIVNNTFFSLLGQIVTWTSTLLLTIAFGRFLGDIKFGELYTAITFVLLIGFPLEFGFNQQIIRDVAQDTSKVRHYLSNVLLIKLVLWSLLYGISIGISYFVGYNAEQRILIVICGLTLLSTAITNTYSSLYYALERTIFPIVGTVLEKSTSALIGIILLMHGADVKVMAFVLLAGSLFNGIWQVIWFYRLIGVSFTINFSLIRELIRTSIPFLTYGVLGIIYYRIDTVLLSIMVNAATVGWYGAAYRLFDTMGFLPGLLIRPIMYPVFSKLSVTSKKTLKQAIEKSMNFLLVCGIPITTGLIVAAPNIIHFLYSRPEFIPAIPTLQALAPGLVLLYANTVFNTVILSTKQEKKITLMAAIALVFNLGLNFMLIPLYKQVGAAIVTTLTELLLLCLSIVFTPKHLLPLGSLMVAAKALLASLVMALAIWGLNTLHISNMFIILPVSMVVYFSVAMLLKTVQREDLQMLFSAVRHKAQSTSPTSP